MNMRAPIAILLLTLGTWSTAVAAPEGQLTWAVHVSLAPAWFDPAETVGDHHALHVPLRDARRAREVDAGQRHGPQPGRVVDRLAR